MSKPLRFRWTTEALKESAALYKSRIEWAKSARSAYSTAGQRKILNECCAHMTVSNRRGPGFKRDLALVLENCMAKAKLYTCRTEWAKGHQPSYQDARKNGWLKECSAHLKSYSIPFEVCQADAKKYESKKEWRKQSVNLYSVARANGWIEEFFKPSQNDGVTKEECLADAQRFMAKSTWMQESFKFATAAKTNGWYEACISHMPIHKTRWSLEKCLAESRKFSSRKHWCKGSPRSAASAKLNGWMDECVKANNWPTKIKKQKEPKHSKQDCLEDAGKYETRTRWKLGSRSLYHKARKNGWLDECLPKRGIHIGVCKESANKFTSVTKWKEAYPEHYAEARARRWTKEICSHMENDIFKWSKETCLADALKYQTRTQWARNSISIM
jgi:hypothetical protein